MALLTTEPTTLSLFFIFVFFFVGVFQTPFAALCSGSLIQTGENKSGTGKGTGVKKSKDNGGMGKMNHIILCTL